MSTVPLNILMSYEKRKCTIDASTLIKSAAKPLKGYKTSEKNSLGKRPVRVFNHNTIYLGWKQTVHVYWL